MQVQLTTVHIFNEPGLRVGWATICHIPCDRIAFFLGGFEPSQLKSQSIDHWAPLGYIVRMFFIIFSEVMANLTLMSLCSSLLVVGVIFALTPTAKALIECYECVYVSGIADIANCKDTGSKTHTCQTSGQCYTATGKSKDYVMFSFHFCRSMKR